MPTPLYALRLPLETQEAIVAMAKLCGYPNGRAFAARVLRAAASGSPDQMEALRNELLAPVGVQLPLTFPEQRKRPARAGSRVTKKHGPPPRSRK